MNVLDVLDDNKIEYRLAGQHHHATQGWCQIDCPQCSLREGKFRLGINLERGYCSCWTCGYISLYRVFDMLLGLPTAECWKLIHDLPIEKYLDIRQHAGKLEMPADVSAMGWFHRQYVQDRGFNSKRIANVWGVEGIGQLGGILRWRLFIPVHKDMEVVSWTTRSLNNLPPRYRNARDDQSLVPIRDCLYGIDHVRNAAVVVEGPLDVWRIGPGAVALLGQNCSQANMDALSRIPLRVICFDSEPAAQARANKLADALSVYPGRTIVIQLESAKDAAGAQQGEIESLRREFLE
jgi:hypothetical protein